MLGYPEQALTRSRQACALAQKLSHPYSLTYALVFASALSMFRREAQRVQEQAEAAIAVAREQRFARWLAVGMGWRGWAVAEQGAVPGRPGAVAPGARGRIVTATAPAG